MTRLPFKATLLTLASTLAFVSTLALVAPSGLASGEPEPWLRVNDSREGVLDLDVAERRYSAEGKPDITFVGAIHIGDPRFYKHLMKTLDGFDVVLYEGVGPAGAGGLPDDLSDEKRVSRTESRIRLLAITLETIKRASEAEDVWEGYPASFDEMHERIEKLEMNSRVFDFLTAASKDGWGNDMLYSVTDDGEDFTIRSLGADGQEGGRGVDRDLSFALQPPLSDAELGAEPGLQQKMADTFGLAFQSDIMNHDDPRNINSDLSVDEVRDLLEAKGADGSMIFGMLDGSSAMAQMADIIFGLIKFIPGGAAMGKLMMMEMLANADDALALAGQQQGMDNPAALMDVIIGDRNAKVIEDLKGFVAAKRMYQNGIAVIYGAGHMPDLEERLTDELGYELVESDWNLAIRLNLRKEGISPAMAEQLRSQIHAQLQAMGAGAGE